MRKKWDFKYKRERKTSWIFRVDSGFETHCSSDVEPKVWNFVGFRQQGRDHLTRIEVLVPCLILLEFCLFSSSGLSSEKNWQYQINLGRDWIQTRD